MSLQCLDNVIGLTRSTCEAIIENLGDSPSVEWYKQSESGLFLDEVPGIVSIKSLEQSLSCQTELASFYQQAIETAKTELRDDMIVGISERYRQAAKNFKGAAGGRSFSGNIAMAGTYAGLYLQTSFIRGGKLSIKGIYGMFQAPPTVLKLYKMARQTFDLEFVQDIPVTFNANILTLVNLTTAIELSTGDFEYFLLYETAGVIAKNNSVSCGCGSSEAQMKRYLNLIGASGSDVTAFQYWPQSSNGNGLALEVEVGCEAESIVCELYTSDISYKTVIPHAIRYKAAELVTEKILGSDEVNRFTLMSREYLWGKRNHFQKEYVDRITYMIETLDITSATDCFVCNDSHKKLSRNGILV